MYFSGGYAVRFYCILSDRWLEKLERLKRSLKTP